jgi:ERCC4-type nuclease
VTIERKSLSDLLGCIGRERDRFVRELRQLRAFRFAALVIEARWPDIESGLYGGLSQVNPNAVIGSLMAFAVKYGVVPIMADDHHTAARLVERLLSNYSRLVERDYRALAHADDAGQSAKKLTGPSPPTS